VYILTYTIWGPALAFGHNANFRLHVAGFLASVALFPPALFTLARRRLPVAVMAAQSLMALGTAFTVVWREESDLYFWIYVAEMAAFAFAVVVLRVVVLHLWQVVWGRALFFTSVAFLVMVGADMLVDVGVIPRVRVGFGELYSPIGLVPFSIVLSFALVARWAERRWGEPMDLATGLLTLDRFSATLGREMDRSRRSSSPLTIALLRVSTAEPLAAPEQTNSQAAKVLRRSLRQVDLLARRSEDTFAILLADTEERAAMATLDRLRRAISDGIAAGYQRPSTAAGVAQYRPARHAGPPDLLAEAEGALYAAISEGGDSTATAP
jgi:GGDEF domain-containing protein